MQPVPDQPTRRRTAALVLNENAGGALGRDGDDPLRGHLSEMGFETADMPAGDLIDRLQQARDHGADIVVIAGGDGTVACAARVLTGSGRPLGIVPLGTMNLLAKDLLIPAGDTEAAMKIVATGTAREIDVAEIRGADGEPHIFLCAAMLGSPARLGHHREEGRRRGNGMAGWLHFARALARAPSRHRALNLTVTVDGHRHRLRTVSLTLTVNALDAITDRMFGRSCLDGGELCAYAVRHHSVPEFLRLLFHTVRGQISTDPAVTVLRGRTMEIDGPGAALRILIDGEERLLTTPLRASLLHDRLTVIAPAA